MNSNVKNLLYFISGAAVGAVGMWYAVKAYYEKKSDEEVSSVKEAFEDRLIEIEDNKKSSLSGELEGPKEIDEKTKSHKDLVNKLNNKPDMTDYTKYFMAKGEKLDSVSETIRDAKEDADRDGLSEDELAQMEHPEEDEAYTNEEDEEETLKYEDQMLNGKSKQAIENDEKPYEIDKSDYELTCANYEKISLSYYHFDQVLMEDEEEVYDQHRLIGNMIEETGFDQNNVDMLYVRNDKIMVDFEITKIYSYLNE